MAAATPGFFRLREERVGRLRVLFMVADFDTNEGGTDGVALAAGSDPFTDVSQIVWVDTSGPVETGGYVAKYVVTAEAAADGPGNAGACGDGTLIIYESDDAVDPLDATADDVGAVYFKVWCY